MDLLADALLSLLVEVKSVTEVDVGGKDKKKFGQSLVSKKLRGKAMGFKVGYKFESRTFSASFFETVLTSFLSSRGC